MKDDEMLLNPSLSALKRSLVHPDKNNNLITLALLIFKIYCFYLVYVLFRKGNIDIDVFMDSMETITSLAQGICKLVALIFYRNELRLIIQGVDKFWSHTPWNKKVLNFTLKLMKTYIFLIFSTLTLLFIRSIYLKRLILVSWVPTYWHAYEIILLGQLFMLFMDCNYVFGLDSLFFALCVCIHRQFELMQKEIQDFDKCENEDELLFKIKSFIKHHSYMLSYTNLVIRVYENSLLLQYGVSTYSICVQMFSISERFSLSNMFTCFFYICSVVTQLSIYCFPSEQITKITSEVAASMYEFKWYKYSIRIQKYVPHIMNRSQKLIYFKAGGLVPMNHETFTAIFRNSLSFLTLVTNLKAKKD